MRDRPWAAGTPPPIQYQQVERRWQPPTRKPTSWRAVIKTVMAFGMLTFVVQLVLALYSLLYGVHLVLPEITEHSYSLYVIAPVLVEIGAISGDALGIYYLLIVAAIVASAAWVFLTSAKGYYKELVMKAEPRKHSQIFDLCSLMFAVLFLNVIVVLITGVLWEEPTTPVENVDLWELLFLLANASVWEELVVRVLLIGIPMIFVDLVRRTQRDKIRAYLLGGGFSFGFPEVALVIVSSALFGLGHLDGWGWWKVFPAAVAGVAFGYMFLKHGLASAILLHFGFDYLSVPLELFTDSSDLGALMLLGLAILIWVAMGAVFFGYYLLRMSEFVTGREFLNDSRPVPQYYGAPYGQARPPPTSGYGWQYEGAQTPQGGYRPEQRPPMGGTQPGGLFICPVCGNVEARWLDTGRFQCLRCGAIV